ncbi:Hypothetical predicted protein [Cloeon dipterum]|uniref:Peptidase S1 domain-containing protein n=1 Tax=Cloeon dipterum TaxID=197152 RepID=A0A8S1DPS5_9INSE|nr:Hypothetical predicted protein [Cloeon dipterum]
MNFRWSLLFFAAFCADFTWARVVVANPLVDQQLTLKGSIIGGTDAGEGEVPWQVSLQKIGSGHFCGGTIVSRKHIVTAAHCSKVYLFYIYVVAGSIHPNEGTGVGVRSIANHPNYYHLSNDIAVWEVDSPFIWSENIQPARIANSRVQDGWLMTVSGWGLTDQSVAWLPSSLQKAEVRIVSKEKCDELYKAKIGSGIFENNICAGGEGQDTCFGDSGGPLVKDGVLHGVVSWGYGAECGAIPGVYTEVASFANWINSVITEDSK